MLADISLSDDLIQRLEASETRKRFPAEAFGVMFSKVVPLQFQGAFVKLGTYFFSMVFELAEAGRSHPNPSTRYVALQATYNAPAYWGMYMLSDDFSWDSFCGERGCTVVQAAHEYDFERGKPAKHRGSVHACWHIV